MTLAAVDNTIVRRIAGAVFNEGVGKYVLRSTEEARGLVSLKTPALARVRDAQMRWSGHGARGSACMAASCALEATADGGRARRGKPTWMEQIDDVTVALECEDWQVAAQDRDEWKQICLQARELPDPWTVHNTARKERIRRRAAGQEEQGVDAEGGMDVDDPPPL